jgi:hypothetical protein
MSLGRSAADHKYGHRSGRQARFRLAQLPRAVLFGSCEFRVTSTEPNVSAPARIMDDEPDTGGSTTAVVRSPTRHVLRIAIGQLPLFTRPSGNLLLLCKLAPEDDEEGRIQRFPLLIPYIYCLDIHVGSVCPTSEVLFRSPDACIAAARVDRSRELEVATGRRRRRAPDWTCSLMAVDIAFVNGQLLRPVRNHVLLPGQLGVDTLQTRGARVGCVPNSPATQTGLRDRR